MTVDVGGIAGDRLKSFVERIERLEEEKRGLAEDIKEVYAEAKGTGFDTKIIRKLVALRRRDANTVAEEEALLDVYKRALGMLSDTPLGRAAVKEKFGAEVVDAEADTVAEPKPKKADKVEAGAEELEKPAKAPKAEKAAKSKPVDPPPFHREREMGTAAASAGRTAATNPYPVATAARDAWQGGWTTGWNARAGKEPVPDRSLEMAAAMGAAAADSLVIDNPFRAETQEAAAWEREWNLVHGGVETAGAAEPTAEHFDTVSVARENGSRDWVRGQDRDQNRYEPGSPQFTAWLQGWDEEEARADDSGRRDGDDPSVPDAAVDPVAATEDDIDPLDAAVTVPAPQSEPVGLQP